MLSASKKLSFQARESMSSKFVESNMLTKVSNITPTPTKVSSSSIWQLQNTKRKQVAREPSKQGSNNVRCYNCHKFGHYTHECPSRNLMIQNGDEGEIEEPYPVLGVSSDVDEEFDEEAPLHVIKYCYTQSTFF